MTKRNDNQDGVDDDVSLNMPSAMVKGNKGMTYPNQNSFQSRICPV